MKYDDKLIEVIDREMGWVEEDGSSPSKTARDLGMHCKFLDGHTAWLNPKGNWSMCMLPHSSVNDLQTTLLAKSFPALKKLYTKFEERKNNPKLWQPYYRALWRRRYLKWCCKGSLGCNCQICRGRLARLKRE